MLFLQIFFSVPFSSPSGILIKHAGPLDGHRSLMFCSFLSSSLFCFILDSFYCYIFKFTNLSSAICNLQVNLSTCFFFLEILVFSLRNLIFILYLTSLYWTFSIYGTQCCQLNFHHYLLILHNFLTNWFSPHYLYHFLFLCLPDNLWLV